MSLRDSLDLIRTVRPDAGTAALEYEIMAERASSLGSAEQRVIKAVAALASAGDDRPDHLRKHSDVIQELKIPREVLAGLGAMPARAAKRPA